MPAVAPRKKGNLKAKLAEKAAQEEERKKAVRVSLLPSLGFAAASAELLQ